MAAVTRVPLHYTPDLLNWTGVNDNGYLAPLAHNDLNQYTSINGFQPSYDGNFNQTTTVYGSTFVYDALNRALGGSMQATYDGLGRCVRRVVNGNAMLFTYDGWNPIAEWDQAGNYRAWNAYGARPDEILVRCDWSGTLIYKLDEQGNVAFILNGSNQIVEKYSYDAFGAPRITDAAGNPRTYPDGRPKSNIGNRFMYTGREYISELGIYDYRHRFYHPSIGRFLQTDPTGFDGGDMNLFRYCSDDPVNHTDPTGLVAEQNSSNVWRNLVDFYSGNPSMSVVQDAWNQRVLVASLAKAIPKGVNVRWDITNKIRLVPYVTKRDNRTVVKERGKPVGAGTRYDFSVTPEDANNVTAHLKIDTQIATQVKTELSRWETVRLEYQNVTAFFDWASKGDGGYIARTAFRQRTYSSGQAAADAVYAELAPSLASTSFWTKFKHDGPFGTHVPNE